MPKLPVKVRKVVDKATPITGDTGFALLEPGKYLVRLETVEAKLSRASNPIWHITFDELRNFDGETFPGKQFYTLNLPTTPTPSDDWKPQDPKREANWTRYQERCAGQLAGFFEVFGFTTDSDTDEMLGEDCVIVVAVRTLQDGPNKGERRNEVRGIESAEDVEVGTGATGDDETAF